MAKKTEDYIRQDRNLIYGRGDELNQEEQDRMNRERNRLAAQRSYADLAYDPLIGGRGGYSPEEQEGMRRTDELNRLQLTPEEIDSFSLTPDEFNRISGSPWDRAAFYDPEGMRSRVESGSTSQRGAVGRLREGLYGAVTPDLDVSAGHRGEVEGTVAGMQSGVRGAVDPERLRTDPEYARRLRMTPGQVQDIVTGAGISAGAGYSAAAGDVERQAAAAGVDPVGAAAMKTRLLKTGAAEAGDAMTLARIRALQTQADREKEIERARQSGETAAAEYGMTSELALGREALGARERLENRRIAAAQTRAGMNQDAARVAGTADVATEADAAARGQRADEFSQGLGTDIATGIEQDTSNRARDLALNRQAVARDVSGERFNRGAFIYGNAAQTERDIANARRQEAAEGRGYLREQAAASQGQEESAAGRRINIYGQQTGAAMQNTQQQQEWDRRPRWWDRAIGAAIGGAAGFVTGGPAGAAQGAAAGYSGSAAPAYSPRPLQVGGLPPGAGSGTPSRPLPIPAPTYPSGGGGTPGWPTVFDPRSPGGTPTYTGAPVSPPPVGPPPSSFGTQNYGFKAAPATGSIYSSRPQGDQISTNQYQRRRPSIYGQPQAAA